MWGFWGLKAGMIRLVFSPLPFSRDAHTYWCTLLATITTIDLSSNIQHLPWIYIYLPSPPLRRYLPTPLSISPSTRSCRFFWEWLIHRRWRQRHWWAIESSPDIHVGGLFNIRCLRYTFKYVYPLLHRFCSVASFSAIFSLMLWLCISVPILLSNSYIPRSPALFSVDSV